MIVAYDSVNKTWKSLHAEVPEIQAPYEAGDYYVWIEDRHWLIRFFADSVGRDQSLGVILTPHGVKIGDIPNFVPPDSRGTAYKYKSRVGWIQDESDVALTMVIECHATGSFRVRFDLDSEIYQFLGYGVR